MTFTDKEAIKTLEKVNSWELKERVGCYPEEERDGRSDLEILKNELDWLLYCMEEPGCALSEELEAAREIARRTRKGCIPLNPSTLRPLYKAHEIEWARRHVNEYNRLKRLQKKMEA